MTADLVILSVAAATFALVCSLIVRTEYGRTGANQDLLNVPLRIAAIIIAITLVVRTIDHIIAHGNLDTTNVRTHDFLRDFGKSLENEGMGRQIHAAASAPLVGKALCRGQSRQ